MQEPVESEKAFVAVEVESEQTSSNSGSDASPTRVSSSNRRRSVAFDPGAATIGSPLLSPTTTSHLSLSPQQQRRHSSKDAGDCRTRTFVQSNMRKVSIAAGAQSMATDSSHVSGIPARIFEHTRGLENPDSLGRSTVAWVPSSWAEIENWLANLVYEAEAKRAAQRGKSVPVSTPSDRESSSIKIVFLNEKRCMKAWKDEVCDFTLLHPYIKVNDWSTSHYQTTYCRYPIPLDVDDQDGEDGGGWEYRYSVSHPFDWDVMWAYLPSTRTTVAIMRTWFDNYDADFQELESIIETFPGPTLSHPMILGLFCLQILTGDTLANVREKGNRVFEAQKMTGFHTYTHLRSTDVGESSDEDESDLSAVTRDILGAASNMTGWDNAAVQIANFARFMMAESARYLKTPAASPLRSPKSSHKIFRLGRYMDEMCEKLVTDLDGAKADAQAWLATATFQLQGVLNLVSQKDAKVNITLAKSSNRIALDTKRDSTSMMAIAIVTMFFLPGTFTSGFFALPYFDQVLNDARSMGVYWGVTVPLTFITLGVFRLWMFFISRETQKQSKKGRSRRKADV